MRLAAKRDANEPDICAALTAAGFKFARVSDKGLPDLIVWRPGCPTFVLMEIKDEDGQLTSAQLKFWTDSAGTLRFIVRSPESAVKVAETWIGRPEDGSSYG